MITDMMHSMGIEQPPADHRGHPSAHHSGSAATGAASPELDLSRLARELEQQLDSPDTMDLVVRWAVQTIPGAQHASISLTQRKRKITSAAATSEVAHAFDALQQDVGQGPCLDAMYDQQTVRVHDLATEERWPQLAQRWAEVGARGALCLQLFVHDKDLGALNVLSEHAGAFDDEAEHVGLLVAAHGAVAVSTALQLEGLSRANINRTVIGQAEGILMERLKISAEVAFAMLARVSQDTNRKLHQVAEDLVATGEVPTTGDRSRR